MLVKFFRHGNTNQNPSGGRTGGGNSVKDYLLGKDNDRANAKLVRGNADLTTEIINGIKQKSKYTSAVLSFAPDEIVSDIEKQKIMQDFENTLFPNLSPDQYSGYWVEHQDKGRTELHCVFANIELQSEKSLPVYYARNDQHLIDSWKEVTNLTYDGLISPNDPSRKRDLAPTQEFEKGKPKPDEIEKQLIHKWLLSSIKRNPDLKSRDDIVNVLKSNGYEVTRQGKIENRKTENDKSQDFISIKNPKGGRNLKLKGALYAPDFDRNYSIQNAIDEYKSTADNRLAEEKEKYFANLEKRAERLNKRFGTIDRTPLDNQLTADLEQIRIENEFLFLNEIVLQRQAEQKLKFEQAMETLSQYNNAILAPDELEQFVTLEQVELLRIKQEQLQVIADIEYKVKSGDDLTPSDEIAYSQAKAFTNSLDNILEQQRQAQEQARQLAEEQARQQVAEQDKATVKYQLDTLATITGDTYEHIFESIRRYDIPKLENLKSKHEQNISNLERLAHAPMPKTDFEQDLESYQESKNYVASIDMWIEVIQEQQEYQSRLNTQANTMQTMRDPSNVLSPSDLVKFERLDNDELEHTLNYNQHLATALENKAVSEILTRDELNDFNTYCKTVNSLTDLTAQRDRQAQELARLAEQKCLADEQAQKALAEQSKRLTTPTATTTAPTLPSEPQQADIAPSEPVLTAKQKLVFDNFINQYELTQAETIEIKEKIANASSDKQLLDLIDNPYKSDSQKYISLVNKYAQDRKTAKLAKMNSELKDLKALVPPRPDNSLSDKEFSKQFDKWEQARLIPQSNVRKQEIAINDFSNTPIVINDSDHQAIADSYPNLAESNYYSQTIERFRADVERQLRELDKQQQTQQPDPNKDSNKGR